MDHQPDDGTEPVNTENTPDTGDLIGRDAPDPRPEPVTDPDHPSYVEPAHAAVRVNPDMFAADPEPFPVPKWVDEEIATTEAQLTAQIRRMTGRTDIRVVVDRSPLGEPQPPSGTVGTSLPDAPDTAAEADPEGCA